jgi:hypothetical protein
MATQAVELGFDVEIAWGPVEAWKRGEQLAGSSPLIGIGSHYLVGAIFEELGLDPG